MIGRKTRDAMISYAIKYLSYFYFIPSLFLHKAPSSHFMGGFDVMCGCC